MRGFPPSRIPPRLASSAVSVPLIVSVEQIYVLYVYACWCLYYIHYNNFHSTFISSIVLRRWNEMCFWVERGNFRAYVFLQYLQDFSDVKKSIVSNFFVFCLLYPYYTLWHQEVFCLWKVFFKVIHINGGSSNTQVHCWHNQTFLEYNHVKSSSFQYNLITRWKIIHWIVVVLSDYSCWIIIICYHDVSRAGKVLPPCTHGGPLLCCTPELF